MKYGFRTPNVKKRVSARTTGRLKRSAKKVVPGYGAKGMGMVNDPSKAINNKIYHTTTTGIDDIPTTTTTNSNDFGCGCLGCIATLMQLLYYLFMIAVNLFILFLIISFFISFLNTRK
ncbi:MAG: hypothetical protein HXK75_04095 [Granulicatella sp.]|nr:hypothetical protein [Granulicatella sp.]